MSIISMSVARWRRVVAVASVTLTPLSFSQHAIAGAQEYRFELVGPPVASGKATASKVRLTHIPDGKPVSGALITQTRFDMGPEGMAAMAAPARATATADPGIYQIDAEPSMPGKWALTFAAKVQGEPETVRGTVTITVP